MAAFSRLARGVAAAIALASCTGLAAQFSHIIDEGAAAPRALWIMLRYFTNLTNLAIAVIFTGLALGRDRFAIHSLLGGVAISSGLVAVVSYWLLNGTLGLSGETTAADILLNCVAPIAVLIFWLELTPKGRLTVRDAFLWLIWPLAYFDYAILRGAAESSFAYRFLNGSQVGWDRTFWTGVFILASFLDASLALVWVDQSLGKRPNSIGIAQ